MKQFIFVLLLLFAFGASAGNIEQKIQQRPEISKTCEEKLAKYEAGVQKYKLRYEENRTVVNKFKLHYYKEQLKNWTEYCFNPNPQAVE